MAAELWLWLSSGALLLGATATLFRITRPLVARSAWFWVGLLLLSASIACAATAVLLHNLGGFWRP